MKRSILLSFPLFFLISLSLAQINIVESVSIQAIPSITQTPLPNVEYNLPYPGILPDHPFYFLKVLRDKILEVLTQNPVKKIQLKLLLSDKQIVMGQLLLEKGNVDLSTTTVNKGEKYLLATAADLVRLKNSDSVPTGLSDKIQLAAKKHEEIITQLMSKIPDETKRGMFSESLGINHQAIQQISSIK